MGNKIYITGQKFGKLTALSESIKKKHTYVLCECECGNTHVAEKYHLMKGHITKCVACGHSERPRRQTHPKYTGHGEISGDFWLYHVVRSAAGVKTSSKIKKPKELTITIEYAWDLFLKQERKCALTGMELFFPQTQSDKLWTASIDRIDSSKGYIPGNIQWVHKHINMMKRIYDQDYFIEMCEKVAKNCNRNRI